MLGRVLKVILSCGGMFVFFKLFVGCTPEPLELDNVSSIKPEIVVSSQILADSSVVVLLTRTVNGVKYDKEKDKEIPIEQIALNDAVVTIAANKVTYTLEPLKNGMYKAMNIPLVAGRTYTLKVNSKSLGTVTATTTVQSGVRFDTVKAKIFFNGFNDYWAEVDYAFKDPPMVNYYMLNVQQARPVDLFDSLLNTNTYTRLVEDRAFNGEEFSEVFHAINRNFFEGDSISVSLTNVSLEYYNYVKLRVENNMELVEVFSEPVHYPTNIKGGKGFFNLHFPDARLIVLY